MGFGILGTGISGLRVAQQGLDTTGNNIANVNTQGYNRQRAEQISTVGIPFGGVLQGNGSQISSIARAYNSFSYSEILFNTQQFNFYDTQVNNASRLDDLLADSDTGITVSIEDMFDAINGVTEEPTVISARNVLISSAEAAAQRFNNLHTEIEQQHLGNINDEISTTVDTINDITTQIAQLNAEISVAKANAAQGFEPNDLLDKRDLLLKDLSKKVSIDIIDIPDGTVNVSAGKGVTLVAGNYAIPVFVDRNEFDSGKLEIATAPNPNTPNKTIVTSQIEGGSLGGLLKIRDEFLIPTLEEIGKLAIGYADAYNRQQTLGRDLNGNVGQNLFKDVNDPQVTLTRTLNSKDNPLSTDFNVYIRNTEQLSSDNYFMEVNVAGDLVVTDKDNTVLATFNAADQALMAGGTALEIPGTGVTLDIANNNLAVGDRFQIRPTLSGARDISLTMTDPQLVAAADNYFETADVVNPSNVQFELYEFTNIADPSFPIPANVPPLPDSSLQVVINAAGTQYDIQDSGGASLIGGFSNIPADQLIEGVGIRFKLDGTLAGGETFTITHADNATIDTKKFGQGDNNNALAMLDLQNSRILDGGTNSFSESYAEIVTFVGVKTQTAQISASSFSVLLSGAEERNSSISGVNLDEEAANLIRYQQSYAASARIISIASEVFDTLLQSVR